MQDMALAVERVDALEAQDRRGAGPGVIAGDMLDLGHAGAGIDLLHPAIGAHGVGRAGHQHFALVHHGDGAGEAEHAVDVVLDDQDRNIGGDVFDEVRDALALGGGKARQRLVQQQHLRLGAERDAEIDQPLPAIGEFAALDGLDAFEAEEFDQLRGLGMDIPRNGRCRARG